MWSGEPCSYPEHPREWEQDAQRLQMKCAEHTPDGKVRIAGMK